MLHGPIVPVKLYVAIFLALLALTAVTTWVAFYDFGAMNTVVALVVAFTKMSLVILFFMHVKYSSSMTKVIIAAGFFWLTLLIALVMADVRTRYWSPTPQDWSPSLASPASSPAQR